MEIIKGFNLLIRFLLELAILFIFGYWGVKFKGTQTIRVILGIGLPLITAIFWGVFMAPKADIVLPQPLHTIIEMILFGLAALAIYDLGFISKVRLFIIITILNKVLMILWKQ